MLQKMQGLWNLTIGEASSVSALPSNVPSFHLPLLSYSAGPFIVKSPLECKESRIFDVWFLSRSWSKSIKAGNFIIFQSVCSLITLLYDSLLLFVHSFGMPKFVFFTCFKNFLWYPLRGKRLDKAGCVFPEFLFQFLCRPNHFQWLGVLWICWRWSLVFLQLPDLSGSFQIVA